MVILIIEDVTLGWSVAREHLGKDKVTYATYAEKGDRDKIVRAIEQVVDKKQ